MTHVTCRLAAKNRDQLWNPTLSNRVRATFTFLIKVCSKAFQNRTDWQHYYNVFDSVDR